MNRQRKGYCQRRMPHVTWWAIVKVFLNELFSIEDSLISTIKPQQKTTLFCFGSFLVDPQSLITVLFCFVFCFVFVFFFVFSDKTTVQWYFIVGPLLAVTVLAFVVLYLWKRRIAGTYTSSNVLCILNAISQWKTPNMHSSDYNKQHKYIFLTTFILKGEIRLFSLGSNDYFFILFWSTKVNIIK